MAHITVGIPFMSFTTLLLFFAFEFDARSVFIGRAYCRNHHHGKTWKRAKKHYKSNWTFWERLLWVPVFKEEYILDFKLFPIFSYIHLLLSIVNIPGYILLVCVYDQINIYVVVFVVWGHFALFRAGYTDAIGRGKIW